MLELDNMIIIGATGRNTGKTELACSIIEKFKEKNIIALKITTINEIGGKCPTGKNCGVCTSLKNNFSINEEKCMTGSKDTQRMLAKGAFKVYWLRVLLEYLEEGINEFIKLIDKKSIIICESNSIRNLVKPGLFIITKNSSGKKTKKSCQEVIDYADKLISFNEYGTLIKSIQISENKWYIR